MNDIFYYFGFVFLVLNLKNLIFFNEEFEELYPTIAKVRGYMSWAKQTLENKNQMDMGEILEAKDTGRDILRDNLSDLDDSVRPTSFKNIIGVIYLIWIIVGICVSDLWFLFSLNMLIFLIGELYPIFFNIEKNKTKLSFLIRDISGIVIIILIQYLYFG